MVKGQLRATAAAFRGGRACATRGGVTWAAWQQETTTKERENRNSETEQ